MLEEILATLVKIPSLSGDTRACNSVIDYVKTLLDNTTFTSVKGIINDVPYLIAHTTKPNKKMMWYISHLDVMPADKKLFCLQQDEQNYYGRGVFDMKGMAAAILSAAIANSDRDVNVGLIFTTDEEIGGKNGVGSLVEKDFIGDVGFVFDQSSDWVLQERMKGVVWFEIVVKGKAAHGARPWLGSNANTVMIDFLSRFGSWFDENMQYKHKEDYVTTYNIGTMRGGTATNQVASIAKATIDMRYISDTDREKIIKNVHTIAAMYKNITINKLIQEPCVNTDPQSFWFTKTEQLMSHLNIAPGKHGEKYGHGSTDGRYLAPLHIPVITTRPPGGGQHGAREWVSKKGLWDLEKLCTALIAETAKLSASTSI